MTSNERRIIPGWKNDLRRKPAARTAVRSQRSSSRIYLVVVRVVRASLKARLAKRIGTSVPHAMRPVGKAGVFAVGVRVMVGCLVAVYNFRFFDPQFKTPVVKLPSAILQPRNHRPDATKHGMWSPRWTRKSLRDWRHFCPCDKQSIGHLALGALSAC